MKTRVALLCVALSVGMLAAEEVQHAWLSRVPESDRRRTNPFENDTDAILAGKKLFTQHCASCHGASGEGKNKRPNLHTDAIRNASPGELQWLLTNGSMKKG